MGDWLLERWRGETAESNMDDIARRLGGEADGFWITAPDPGRPRDDRSLRVHFDPKRPGNFYVYSTGVRLSVAKAHVRSILDLTTPVQADAAERKAKARRVWDATVAGEGTLVETYIRLRAITLRVPPALRFHGQLRHWKGEGYWPVMVGIVTDKDGHFLGIHATFLLGSGRGKAPIIKPKLMLGPIGGGAIRLGEGPAILVAEGIETAMSGTILDREHRPAWAAMSEGGMRSLRLPPSVNAVTFLADNDDDGQSVKAANIAKRRALAKGLDARVAVAPAGQDFNDQLQNMAKARRGADHD